jgi:hypothetical protein
MNRRKIFCNVAALTMTFWFAGCATVLTESEGIARSDALLQKQLEMAQKAAPRPEGRLLFAGFALHSQSKAFRNDVATAEKAALAIDPHAIIFKLSNPARGQDTDWPYATFQNMDLVLKKIGTLAQPKDKIVVLISTHGNVNVLAINSGGKDYPYINSRVLGQALAALRDKPTLLLLSACHSGSFIEPLSASNRIMLAAAARDRSSFGCQFQSTNTYFVDALLNQPSMLNLSVVQLMEQARVDIDRRERAQRLSPPSLPQIFVGNATRDWANQPTGNWLKDR